MRKVVRQALEAEKDIELVGTAVNGLEALLRVEELQPDVVTLDVEMPRSTGARGH